MTKRKKNRRIELDPRGHRNRRGAGMTVVILHVLSMFLREEVIVTVLHVLPNQTLLNQERA